MPEKSNAEEFICKAKSIHGNRYIYDSVEYIDSKTPVAIICRNHGVFMQNRNNHLQGKGCSKCGAIGRGRRERSANQGKIGSIVNGYKIIGSNKLTGNKHRFILECDVCSKDEDLWGYGTITSSMSNLKVGQVPCGCSFNPRWTRSQREIQVARKCQELGYEFVGFYGEWRGYLTKVELSCPRHGLWRTSTIEKILNNTLCPSCGNTRSDKAYINYITDYGVVKFGVCFDLSKRIKIQKLKNRLDHLNLGLWKFESRDKCLDAEAECKKALETSVLTKGQMPDGYTETTYAYNVEKIIAIYEKHGGVRV